MSGNESQEVLAERLTKAAERVMVGGRYRHYKGQIYTVLAVGLLEENGRPCVVYQAEYGERVVWIRPVASWVEEVDVGERKVKRFASLI